MILEDIFLVNSPMKITIVPAYPEFILSTFKFGWDCYLETVCNIAIIFYEEKNIDKIGFKQKKKFHTISRKYLFKYF